MDGKLWLAALIFSISPQVCAQSGQTNKSAVLADADTVAKAMKALELPPGDGPIPNAPPHETKSELLYQYHANCRESINLLTRTEATVDKELLTLAESNKPLHVRHRAVYILANRRNVAVVPLLDKMCKSEDVNERYVTWEIYRRALGAQKLPPPKDVTRHVALYDKESDEEVRESMEWFFGAAKAKAAVKPLLASLDRNPREALPAIWSLGMIGDSSAVPAIIKNFEHSGNPHYHVEALGRLATTEAVDFIVDHLDVYGAADALYRSKSKKALPAFEKHLEKLKQDNAVDTAIDLAATRIAITRLRQDDCREDLLKIAEDRKEDHHARWDAFSALQEYDTTPYAKRILGVYKDDPDGRIKRICIWLLQDSKMDGITEAMMDHALQTEKIGSKDDLATEYALLEALNKRLGTILPDMEKMRDHIRKQRK